MKRDLQVFLWAMSLMVLVDVGLMPAILAHPMARVGFYVTVMCVAGLLNMVAFLWLAFDQKSVSGSHP